MTTYYAIKVRKDMAIVLPIIFVLLVIGFFGARAIWNWQPGLTVEKNTTSPETNPTIKPTENPKDLDCTAFQQQLDQYAQQAFKDGYLCTKKQQRRTLSSGDVTPSRESCPVPEGLSYEEQNQLERKSTGYYFDAKKFVNTKSSTKDYYTNLMIGDYACTAKNLELLKKFVYEQQWKNGIAYNP